MHGSLRVNTEIFFGWQQYKEVGSQQWSSTHKKQLEICIEYTYISEFMLKLHWGKFMNVKWVKVWSLTVKLWQKPLRNRTYLGKNSF